MGTRGEGGVGRGEVAVAVRAVELVGANAKFDRLRAQREVFDGGRLVGLVDGVAGAATRRAQPQGHAREDRQTQRVSRPLPMLVDDLEAWKVQRLRPKVQTIPLAHESLSVGATGRFF